MPTSHNVGLKISFAVSALVILVFISTNVSAVICGDNSGATCTVTCSITKVYLYDTFSAERTPSGTQFTTIETFGGYSGSCSDTSAYVGPTFNSNDQSTRDNRLCYGYTDNVNYYYAYGSESDYGATGYKFLFDSTTVEANCMNPVNIIIKDTSGNPISGQQVTVYKEGTSTKVCDANTAPSGRIQCGLDSSQSYNVYIGTNTGTLIYTARPAGEITSRAPRGLLTLTLKDFSGSIIPNGLITVYETGTSTIACKGKTTATGQIKCSLHTGTLYDIETAVYTGTEQIIKRQVSAPNTLIIQPNWLITLNDIPGNPISNQQVTVYESGTSTIACGGQTSSSGQILCVVDINKDYESYIGDMGANTGILFFVGRPTGQIISSAPRDLLTIELKDLSNNPLSDQEVTVYEAGTSTVACTAKTSASGQIMCGLDSSKIYDIINPITNVYGRSAPDYVVIKQVPTLLSLYGTVKYLDNSPVGLGSLRIQIKNPDTGASIWGPYDFNNVFTDSDFGIVLGGLHSLTIPKNERYKLEIAFCDLSTFSASCTGSHYDMFTTYFMG